MIINCTYNKQNGFLVCKHKYNVAQYNNLADTVNIKCVEMTDPCDYGYYIDFVCYNKRGAAKAVFTSPKLEYGEDGLNFVVPNCLTQYVGYVQAQLVIYDKQNNDIIAKSVDKGGSLFEVVASANALETQVLDTPNMMTELEKAVAKADVLHQDMQKAIDSIYEEESRLEQKFTTQIVDKIEKVMSVYKTIKVVYCFYDKIVKEELVCKGGTLSGCDAATFIPSTCECDGWYSKKKGRLWDFESDTADEYETVYLYANCRNTKGMTFENGVCTITNDAGLDFYIPFVTDDVPTVSVKGTYDNYYSKKLFLPDKELSFANIAISDCALCVHGEVYRFDKTLYFTKDKVAALPVYYPYNSSLYFRADGGMRDFEDPYCMFAVYEGNMQMFPITRFAEQPMLCTFVIKGECSKFMPNAFKNSPKLQSLVLYCLTPPALSGNALPFDREDFTVYVRDELVNMYKSDYEWKDANIKPISECGFTLPY